MGQSYLVLITKCNKITSQRNSYLGSIKTCPHFQLKCIFTPLPKSFLCSRRIKGESCHSLKLEHCRYNIYPRAAVATFFEGRVLGCLRRESPFHSDWNNIFGRPGRMHIRLKGRRYLCHLYPKNNMFYL